MANGSSEVTGIGTGSNTHQMTHMTATAAVEMGIRIATLIRIRILIAIQTVTAMERRTVMTQVLLIRVRQIRVPVDVVLRMTIPMAMAQQIA